MLTNLAEYMIPSAYVFLDTLPLTPNGKLDRQALPAPDSAATISRAYEAPQGEIEEQLAAIWQSLLKQERIGRHDNFFELGGHSLLAVQLVSHINSTFDITMPLDVPFARPTIARLEESIIDYQLMEFDAVELDALLPADAD